MNAEGLERGHFEGTVEFAGVRPGPPKPGYGRMCAGCRHAWGSHQVEYVERAGQPPASGLVSCPQEGCWCLGTWCVKQ